MNDTNKEGVDVRLESIFKEKFGHDKTLGKASKIDWVNSPDWAKWCAQDADGCWSWFSTKPQPYDFGLYVKGTFMPYGKGIKKNMSEATHIMTNPNKNWRSTVEKRPTY